MKKIYKNLFGLLLITICTLFQEQGFNSVSAQINPVDSTSSLLPQKLNQSGANNTYLTIHQHDDEFKNLREAYKKKLLSSKVISLTPDKKNWQLSKEEPEAPCCLSFIFNTDASKAYGDFYQSQQEHLPVLSLVGQTGDLIKYESFLNKVRMRYGEKYKLADIVEFFRLFNLVNFSEKNSGPKQIIFGINELTTEFDKIRTEILIKIYKDLFILAYKYNILPESSLKALKELGKNFNSQTSCIEEGNLLSILDIYYSKFKKPSKVNSEKIEETNNSCPVCLDEFNSEEGVSEYITQNCQHGGICRNCFKQNILVKIKDNNIHPHINCPHNGCHEALAAGDFGFSLSVDESNQSLDLKNLIRLLFFTYSKQMKTFGEHRVCHNCDFINPVYKNDKLGESSVCSLCKMKDKSALDDEIEKAVRDGVLKKCPRCSEYNSKDKGMCNSVQCVGCRIWINWLTQETFKTDNELKEQARRFNTMWMPGELEYQQKLQRENPKLFKELLERNGIQYNPHYRRGSN
jgi:hypothetical protein